MKSGLLGCCLVIAALAASTPASAVTLTGSYAVLSNKICQINLSWTRNPATGDTNSFAIPGHGQIKSIIGTITFDGAGTMTQAGTQSRGSLVLGNPPPGNLGNITSTAVSGSGPYSVTDSTLTLGSTIYKAVYGGIVGGVANSVRLMRSNPNCIETVILDHE